MHAYRIFQEAASHARRYARADTVAIRLACRDGTVTLLVRDDGHGFYPAGGRKKIDKAAWACT